MVFTCFSVLHWIAACLPGLLQLGVPPRYCLLFSTLLFHSYVLRRLSYNFLHVVLSSFYFTYLCFCPALGSFTTEEHGATALTLLLFCFGLLICSLIFYLHFSHFANMYVYVCIPLLHLLVICFLECLISNLHQLLQFPLHPHQQQP